MEMCAPRRRFGTALEVRHVSSVVFFALPSQLPQACSTRVVALNGHKASVLGRDRVRAAVRMRHEFFE
eukprot:gene14103-biopygen5086